MNTQPFKPSLILTKPFGGHFKILRFFGAVLLAFLFLLSTTLVEVHSHQSSSSNRHLSKTLDSKTFGESCSICQAAISFHPFLTTEPSLVSILPFFTERLFQDLPFLAIQRSFLNPFIRGPPLVFTN